VKKAELEGRHPKLNAQLTALFEKELYRKNIGNVKGLMKLYKEHDLKIALYNSGGVASLRGQGCGSRGLHNLVQLACDDTTSVVYYTDDYNWTPSPAKMIREDGYCTFSTPSRLRMEDDFELTFCVRVHAKDLFEDPKFLALRDELYALFEEYGAVIKLERELTKGKIKHRVIKQLLTQTADGQKVLKGVDKVMQNLRDSMRARKALAAPSGSGEA
jgi:hypothetical protein